MQAGKAVAAGLLGKKCDLLMNPKVMVPSWTEAGARLVVARFLDQYVSVGGLRFVFLFEFIYYTIMSSKWFSLQFHD
jgi:cyclopropane-fatty-acyl-phospholipid synthase